DAIVVAGALASYSILNRAGGIETVTPISIEEIIKGGVAGSTVNVVEPGGVYDGKAMLIAGVPRFAEGRRMLLFLMKTGEDRWNVFPSGVNIFMGTTQEPGAPGGGATAIQTAIGSWDNDCPSNANYVYAGVDDGTHTQGLHASDGRNTVLYERDLSSYGIPPF